MALHTYMRSDQAALLDTINEKADYNDEVEASLRSAVEDFKANHAY